MPGTKNVINAIILVSIFFILSACGPTFEDDSAAILMKPELISIVLDPPEAAPGQTVRASFLMADERGVLEDVFNFWLPASFDYGNGELDMEAAMKESGLDLTQLIAPSIEFEAATGKELSFNSEGLAAETVTLIAGLKEPEEEAAGMDELFKNLDRAIQDGQAETGIRTLVVSQNEERNRNPLVKSIKLIKASGQEQAMLLLHHDDKNLYERRREAAAAAVSVKAGEEITLLVESEDDSTDPLALRYRWVSTGGDFGGFAAAEQPWTAPEYIDPDNEDRTDESDELRRDPNLRPIWLVLRDNGETERLGQSWVEFYVRIEK